MAKNERPLTDRQIEALKAAEPTLFGDEKIPADKFGRSIRGLVNRGLVEVSEKAHVYLTSKGADTLRGLAQ